VRGRKPKTERLRILEQDRERVIGGTTPPTAPVWLEGEAREEWDRVVAILSASYLITPLDQTTLAAYCETFAQWRDCMRQLKTQGFTVPTKDGVKANPLMKIAQSLGTEIRRLAAEFGFTPAARSRIDVSRPESVEEDEFEIFQSSAGSVDPQSIG